MQYRFPHAFKLFARGDQIGGGEERGETRNLDHRRADRRFAVVEQPEADETLETDGRHLGAPPVGHARDDRDDAFMEKDRVSPRLAVAKENLTRRQRARRQPRRQERPRLPA